jgi:CspA family cold shock protein
MQTGTIKKLVVDKGFGFISPTQGEDVFFHSSACTDMQFEDLRQGDRVEYEATDGKKGPRASEVRLAD